MATKLLIRSYDVDVGDCIYVRVPDARKTLSGKDDFHILIDCGMRGRSSKNEAVLGKAIENIRQMLPATGNAGKKRLDLLIVTHAHEDHIQGFNPEFFKDIRIENLWMSAAMNPEHPQAEKSNSLQALAESEAQALLASGLKLDPHIKDMVSLFSVTNANALKALRKGLGGAKPKYVHAGMTEKDLKVVPDKSLKMHVLGPEDDIDKFYLGKFTESLQRGFQLGGKEVKGTAKRSKAPKNISSGDFSRLKSRLLSNSLAFANLSNKLKNNTCVVLLIEWGGRRLLFAGDCEWKNTYKLGKHNGGWNVMWHNRNSLLAKPVDFLKIGHHGSENSTPWKQDEKAIEPAIILDAILPVPTQDSERTAKAIVSTRRTKYETIPRSRLMVELGQRLENTRNYEQDLKAIGVVLQDLPFFDTQEKTWIGKKQPVRTDFETMITGSEFVDIEIEKKS